MCDKLSHMVSGGREGSYGWLHREVVTNPVLCCLYWNRVLVLDELMIQDAAMISLDDAVVQGQTYNGCSL